MSSLLDGVPANIQRDEDDALVCLAEMKVFAAIPTVIERPSTPTPKIMLMYPPKMKAFDPQEWKQAGDAQRWTEFKLPSDAEAWEYREINRAIDTLLLCAMIREAGAAGDEQGALDLLRSLSGNQASASYQDRIQALQWWTPVIQQHDKKVHTLHANTEEQKQTSNARHELWRQIDAEECRKDPWLKRKKQRGKRVCKKLPERFALDYPEIATLNKETVHRQADGGGNPR